MQTHFAPTLLPYGQKTQAYWAIKPARKLVIFVHGFGGSAVGTWKEFPDLLPKQKRCAGWDIVYYGYDGLYTQANISAQGFHGFLHEMGSNPAHVINPTISSGQRKPLFSYNSILIVAHSLGAVVARRALLNALQQNRPWLSHTEMVLFAPAHMGADTIALGGEAISVIPYLGAVLAATAKFKFQPLRDLQPGSATLIGLEKETLNALQQGNAPYLTARDVYIGDKERIVVTQAFCNDPPLTLVPGKTHTSVCKPNSGYKLPVQGVAS